MEKKQKKFKISLLLFSYVSIVYMELVTLLSTGGFNNGGFVFMLLFSFCTALALRVFYSFFKPAGALRGAIAVNTALALIYAVQVVYYKVFGKYFIMYSLAAGGAGQVTEKGVINNTFKAIFSSLPKIILLSLPVLFLVFFGKKLVKYGRFNWPLRLVSLAAVFAVHWFCVLLIIIFPGPREIYKSSFDFNNSAGTFGILRNEWLDVKSGIFGSGTNNDLEIVKTSKSGAAKKSVKYKRNVLDINFEDLANKETNDTLKTLDTYFANEEGTYKNKYTGLCEGYNLVYITAEGFSPYAVDKDLTPTLYKMVEQGFKFNNFYNPIWGVSTSDGEYVTCSGLIPKSGVWSFYVSGSKYMPFFMGNQFNRIYAAKGINKKSLAYHNHTYTYYHRDISHPNMGYNYIGYGNGLEGKITKTWPESDLEMIDVTTGDYITNDEPFHVYYMTVSGHLNYSFDGNAMSKKNKALVENLNCSERLKAYIACNIELDRAMELLLKRLNEAGVADRTLISISNDHYPYGLLDEDSGDKYKYFSEALGHTAETTFEIYKSTWILYCQGLKPKTVNKYCCSMDILPTLSNLLGLKYDSRLLTGKDVFSTAEPLVIFSDRSWITDKGKYDSHTKIFTPASSTSFEDWTEEVQTTDENGKTVTKKQVVKTAKEVEQQYIDDTKKMINNKFKVAALILENDYYKKVVNESMFNYDKYKLLDPVKDESKPQSTSSSEK